MPKTTLILGASPNPSRYASMAAEMLTEFGHEIVLVGLRRGVIAGKEILDVRKFPMVSDVDTVTLYVGPENQKGLYDYMVALKPRRVIFNPGTENTELEKLLMEKGISSLEACTLVMLRTGQY